MATMLSTAKDIADIIGQSSTGFGLTFATNLFVDTEPETPNDCVTIINSGGSEPNNEADIYNPSFMIRVRGAADKYSETYKLVQDILEYLHLMHDEEINNSKFLGIWATSDVLSLGRDEQKNRPVFSINFRAKRTSL